MKKIVCVSFLAVCFLAASKVIAQNAAVGAPQQQAPAPVKTPAAGRAVKKESVSPAPSATPASKSDAKSGEAPAPAARAVKQEGVSNSPAMVPATGTAK
ncbi:MAG: hypothetical protein JNL63_06225 [Bacteroidia bacterium]|nr:hypothetical protein [Bacteroidia bacterium]